MTSGDDTRVEQGLATWPVPQQLPGDLERHFAALSRLRWLVSQLERYQPPVSATSVTVAGAVEQAARTRELLASSLVAFEQLQMACEALTDVPVPHPSALATTTGLGDMAFAARTDLQQVDDRLRRAHAGESHLETLVTCQRAVRRLRRTLWVVVQSVARSLGHAILEDSGEEPGEVESALEVRGAYAEFRRALQSFDAGMPEVSRLDQARAALEALLSHEAFGKVRLSDKVVLWRLAERINSWRGAVKTAREAAMIFSDMKATAELLRCINLRESLVRHDIESLKWFSAQLEQPSHSDEDELRRRALGLLGLDDELDRLVLGLVDGKLEQADADVARALLKRLLSTLEGVRP